MQEASMPYTTRKRKCKQSSGKSGNYELSYIDKNGVKRSSCHTSKEKAKSAISAIEIDKRESLNLLKDLIAEMIYCDS
jgi:hypothetical protein